MISSPGFTRRAALALAAAAAAAPAWAAAPLQVVATTSMIADAARRGGGDRVEVRALMGPGVDPHAYRQTRSDIAALTRADLALWNGLYLEAQLEEFLLELGERRPTVAVAEAIPVEALIAHEDYEGRFDPHVWMVPELWRHAVLAVRDALIAQDPDGAALYRANAEAYLEEADALGAYARETLATVPEAARVLVTAHDAFGYFGRAYGYEVVGVQGISTESEAGLSRVEALVDLIVERGIGAVFVESSVPERQVRALVEGAAARGHAVRVGGELYSDAMGPIGSYEGTWLGMLDHNATTIVRALGGAAPERGRLDRLGAAA